MALASWLYARGPSTLNIYIQVLEENLQANAEKIYGDSKRPFIFQQDNAPCHSAIATKNYFHGNGIMVLPWPSQSPDFNVIENIWLFMKNSTNHNPLTTKNELVERVFEL